MEPQLTQFITHPGDVIYDRKWKELFFIVSVTSDAFNTDTCFWVGTEQMGLCTNFGIRDRDVRVAGYE